MKKFSVAVASVFAFSFVLVQASTAQAQTQSQEKPWGLEVRLGVLSDVPPVDESDGITDPGRGPLPGAYVAVAFSRGLLYAGDSSLPRFRLGAEFGYSGPFGAEGNGFHIMPKLQANAPIGERWLIEGEMGGGMTIAQLEDEPYRVRPQIMMGVGLGYQTGPLVTGPMFAALMRGASTIPILSGQLAARYHF